MSTAHRPGPAGPHEIRAQVGDRLIVEDDPSRTGIIIAVPRPDGTPPFIVKWLATGHIAMVSPGPYARIIPAGTGELSTRATPSRQGLRPGNRDQPPQAKTPGASSVDCTDPATRSPR